jgi:rhodanese-related sulfurtransferase
MTLESLVLPLLIILFFSYKIYKTMKLKKALPKLLASGAVIIDVRSQGEFAGGNNPISINIPLDQIASKTNSLDKEKTYILCCASGTRSAAAVGVLKSKGFKHVMNAGSWATTMNAGIKK